MNVKSVATAGLRDTAILIDQSPSVLRNIVAPHVIEGSVRCGETTEQVDHAFLTVRRIKHQGNACTRALDRKVLCIRMVFWCVRRQYGDLLSIDLDLHENVRFCAIEVTSKEPQRATIGVKKVCKVL